MNPHLLEPPEKRWQCPTCGLQHVTREARPHTPMHPCKGMSGFLAPFVEVHGIELSKKDGVHRIVDREDYINGELVRTDADGRPVMAIDTVRPDGSHDRHAYVATATATSSM